MQRIIDNFHFCQEDSNLRTTKQSRMSRKQRNPCKSKILSSLKQICPSKILETQLFSGQNLNFHSARIIQSKNETQNTSPINEINPICQSAKMISQFSNEILTKKEIISKKQKKNSIFFSDTDSPSPLKISNLQKSQQSTKAESEKSEKQNFYFREIAQEKQISKIHKTQGINIGPSQLRIEDLDLLKLCGQGVYGSVYLARDKKTNFLFALKKILKSSLATSNEKQSFVKETKIHLGLDHPNIIKFYGCFSDQNSVYFVLEPCQDGNLYQILQKKGVFAQKQVKHIIRQVCNGIDYLHSKDIIHRDIKAENIIMHENLAKICDFGWAAEGEYSRKSLCGTPAYISPELIENRFYDKKIDVWSLGILTYELVFGKIPFEIKSSEDFYKIVKEELIFPEEIKVTESCKSFIRKCLEKDPFKRWDTSRLLGHEFLRKKQKQ